MSGVEALGRVKPTEHTEPEYQARYVGKAKYAIVLSGERDTVVGWGYDEESAIKTAQALIRITNDTSGFLPRPLGTLVSHS
jgi:hypothetical protein